MATQIPSFRPELFNPIEANAFPDLRAAKRISGSRGSAYSVSGEQLGIVSFKPGDLEEGMSLNEISRFVRTVLADKAKLEAAVAGKSFDERVYLYLNLEKISSYIGKYNQRADEKLCMLGRIVHVILLILTLGIFSFKNQFHITQISVTLTRLGAAKEQHLRGDLGKLSFLHLVSMSDADRSLVLEKVGHLPKWSAAMSKDPDLLSKLATLVGLTLESLNHSDDLAALLQS